MKKFVGLYYWYQRALVKIFRVLVFILLIFLSAFFLIHGIYPNIPLLLFFIFLTFEIFFDYKVYKLIPKQTVSEGSSNLMDSLTLEAMSLYLVKPTSEGFIKELLKLIQINFINSKANIQQKEIQYFEVDKNDLLVKAASLAKELNGIFITTMDLFIAYLILTEPQTKLLFNKKLKEQDIKYILLWARNTFTKEEDPKGADLTFEGEGIAESWVYGWTIETGKYMLDLSRNFLGNSGLMPQGRKSEYAQLVEALSKGSSAILVGEEGSGKESAVKRLAIDSYSGKYTGNLFHQRIYQLMVDSFMAGAQNQGALQERLNALIAEVSHSGNTIIYIPEFQNILGASSFNLDISGSLIPYLKNGNIRIIAGVSPGAFKRYVEPLHSFLDSFAVVNFDEPSMKDVLDMLFTRTAEIEVKYKVILTYKAIVASYEYAGRYVKEKALPGSAVTLLDDSANVVRISKRRLVDEQDVYDQVKKKTKVSVGEPVREEKQLLLNMEAELHKRVIGQNDAITAISESIRRLRTGIVNAKKPISFLFLGPTGVGKTETAKALADVYFGNGARLVRLDMSEYSGDDGMKRLLGSAPGQGDEKGQLTEPVYDTPYSLVLLDEFEKADEKIHDLFLQVLDDGRLTDNKGKTVSFVNTIIIATSNAASEFIREEIGKGVVVDKSFHDSLLNFLQSKGIFKPELLNRFDDVITFKPLDKTQVIEVVKLMLSDVTKRMSERDIAINFDDKVLQKIATDGYDKDFGARPLRRFIQNKIEDVVAQRMLKDEIVRGDKISVSLDSSGNISLSK